MADNNKSDVQLKEIYDPATERRSVIDTPSVKEGERPTLHPYVIQLATIADDIPQWGVNPVTRDRKLREFWVTEPLLASAVYGVTIRNASFAWEVVGSDPAKPNPKNTVNRITEMLKRSNRGKGWQDLMLKTCTDLYCQDNAAFWYLIRKNSRPDSPVINIAHLDAAQCLSGDTRVLFEDGSTMSIREVVRHRYGGYVMSLNERGELVPQRITDFYETPLGDRHWIQVRTKHPNRAWGKDEQLTLTDDHEVLSSRGWISARELRSGDRVATAYRKPSKEQMELIIGTLLGDAFLHKQARTNGPSNLSFTHAEKQVEWLRTKVNALKGFGWTQERTTRRKIISANSAGNPFFGELREKFYPEGKKVVPVDLVREYFSPRLLAAWFMDDGNKQSGKWGRDKGRLYTCGFTQEDVQSLVDVLNEYGIKSSVQVISERMSKSQHMKDARLYGPYYYVYLTADGFETLSKMVAPFIPTALRYKLPKEIAEQFPYNESLWELVSDVYYDEVVSAEPIENGQQTTTFCIDVESTHNFVAAGTVVHNCLRTGDPKYPVIYTDRKGREHVLRWFEVVTIEEFPSPVEELFGIQVCAVSRCLRAAQILRDIAVYKHEKVSGAWTRSLHFVSNVTQSAIENAVNLAEEQNLNRGLYRYSQPVVVAGLDPKNTISHVQVDLATLPDSFDEETTFKWYIAQLALAFGVDYQEFAPLMSGNLGSSQQAEILHLKTRGKGPALIMTVLENVLNDHGILPANVQFRFKEQDIRSEREKAETKFARAKQRSMMLRSGEIDEDAARRLAVEDGDIPEWMAGEIAARRKKEEREQKRQQQMVNTNGMQQNVPGSEFGTDQIISGIDSHNERQVQLVSMKDVEQARTRLDKFKEASYGPPEMCAILGFEDRERINYVQDYLKLLMPNDDGIRWTYPRDFHITLVYAQLMSWDQAAEVSRRFTSSDVNFDVEVEGTGVFEQPSYNALYLKVKPSEELTKLQRRVYDEVAKLGLPTSEYSIPEQWEPHITLAYLSKDIEIPQISPKFELEAASMSFTRSSYYDEFVVTKPDEELERDAL